MFNWLWVNRPIPEDHYLERRIKILKLSRKAQLGGTLFVKHPDTPQAKKQEREREKWVWESERFLSLIHECNYCINSPFL